MTKKFCSYRRFPSECFSRCRASTALARVALLCFLGQPTKAGFTQGWRELSVLSGKIPTKNREKIEKNDKDLN